MRNVLSLLFATLLLAACFDFDPAGVLGGPAGTWVVDLDAVRTQMVEMAEEELAMAGDEEELAAWREEFLVSVWRPFEEYLGSISFVVLPDGTWEGTSTDEGEAQTSSGTWELHDETVTLRTLVDHGVALETPKEVAATYRDSRLVLSDESGMGLPLVRQ